VIAALVVCVAALAGHQTDAHGTLDAQAVAAEVSGPEPLRAETAYGAPGTIDFIQYWTSGRLLLGGTNPYDASAVGSQERALGVSGEIILLRGPPWTLSLLLPFSLLPFGLAAQLWLILNVLLISVSLIVLHRGLGADRSSLVASAVATACFYPIFQSLIFGQISVVLLAGLAAFLWAESRKRSFLAGVFLAPLTIKPHLFLVFGAILLWRVLKERRIRVASGAAVGVALLLLPVVVLAPASFGQWLDSLGNASTALDVVPVETWKTATLAGLVRGWIFSIWGNAPTWPLWILPLVGLLAAASWVERYGAALSLVALSPVLLCLSYMFAPYGWVFDQAILLPLQVAIVSQAFQRDRPSGSRFGVLALLLGIQLVAILIGLRDEVAQYEFFWIPLALLGVWLWQWPRIEAHLTPETPAKE
jgi:hypothetical protein